MKLLAPPLVTSKFTAKLHYINSMRLGNTTAIMQVSQMSEYVAYFMAK